MESQHYSWRAEASDHPALLLFRYVSGMNCGFAPWRLGVIADRFERIVHLARIRLSRRVPVVHPDFVAVSPGQILVIARNESVTKIDPLHVVAIEELPPSKRTDGRSARR